MPANCPELIVRWAGIVLVAPGGIPDDSNDEEAGEDDRRPVDGLDGNGDVGRHAE